MPPRVRPLAWLVAAPLVAAPLVAAPLLAGGRPPQEPLTDWVDPATGHRVVRLSTEPGSQTLYFHDNAYSPEGHRFVFNSPSGIMLVDLTTLGRGAPRVELAVPRAGGMYMACRTPRAR